MAKANKTIGILTFHSAFSYGAVWQTYALYSYIKELNPSVSIINLNSSAFSVRHIPFHKNPIRSIASSRFSRFCKKMNMTKTYWDDEIRQNFPKFDLYVIGSDQVWNPDITKHLKDIYFGNLCPRDSEKITYAASFGKTEFPPDTEREIATLIHDFSKVSIREQAGVELYRKIKNEDAVRVLDPTFLIQNYKERFHLPDPKKELCAFILDNDSNEPFEAAKQIGHYWGLKPKILNKNKPIKGCKVIPIPSPMRWLKEFAKSEFVLTNSFHGLAFAMHLHKNFLFVCTNPKLGSRAKDLLDVAELSDRFFFSYKDAIESDAWKRSIDYNLIERNLSHLREISMNFLISHI